MVLIVTLLGWSVNQPAIACSGMNSRAAVVVQAGASPAPIPEPSPSRHFCCPAEHFHPAVAQPSPFSDSSSGFTPDLRCCTVSQDSQGMPSLRISVPPPGAKLFILRPQALCASLVGNSLAVVSRTFSPPFSSPGWHTVLR